MIKRKNTGREAAPGVSPCVFSIFQFQELKYSGIFNFQLSIFNSIYAQISAVTNSRPFRDCPPSSATVAFP